MPYKVIVSNSTSNPYVAEVSIYDEKGNFVDGYFVTEFEDKRKCMEDININNKNKKILDNLLPSVADRTITKSNKLLYDKILEDEWERLRIERETLTKYYPFAIR